MQSVSYEVSVCILKDVVFVLNVVSAVFVQVKNVLMLVSVKCFVYCFSLAEFFLMLCKVFCSGGALVPSIQVMCNILVNRCHVLNLYLRESINEFQPYASKP